MPEPVPTDRGEHAAALAALPECGSHRLERLLAERDPAEAWAAVVAGRVGVDIAPASVRATWRDHCRTVDLAAVAGALARLDVVATTVRHVDHPVALVDDIDPAPVIFRRGSARAELSPCVAMVGTRRCSPTGRAIAAEFGASLSAAGVVVVSGLALGIDGAAHHGALSVAGRPPVAVVGSGIDIVYPRRNGDLWNRVARHGALLSEAPLGARPEAWRFPARNRIIAALADVVVVIESGITGGSMHTVEQAERRGRPVLAVPGSIRNPAAAGTNQLISEGATPACGVDDVMVALGLATVGAAPSLLTMVEADTGELSTLQRRVLGSVDDVGATLDVLVSRAGDSPRDVAATVASLESRGLVTIVGGRIELTSRGTATSSDGLGPEP